METLIIGHILGDFFFQTKKMANMKNRQGWSGVLWCSIHILVYTAILALSTGNFSPLFLLGVAVPHWVIDRWSFAYQWMRIVGRSELLKSANPQDASFGAIIYVVLDQTLHGLCLCGLLKIL